MQTFAGTSTIILSYTVLYLLSLLQILSSSESIAYYFAHFGREALRFFAPLLYTLALYLFGSFIFTRANKASDGAIWIIGYTFIGMQTVVTILSILAEHDLLITDLDASCFSSLSPVISHAGGFGKGSVISSIISAVFLVIALLMGIYLVLFGEKRKAENAEQRSDSFWGYRTLIAVFTATGLWWTTFLTGGTGDAILSILWIIFSFILSCIYSRTVKHNWKTILPMLIGIGVGFGSAIFLR